MTRAELIRMFVLNACCDDYEDIEQITKQVDELGPKCGLTITHDDIIQALRNLMGLGYLRAWNLGPAPRMLKPSREYEGMPSFEEIAALNPSFITRDDLAFVQLPTDLSEDSGILSSKWISLEAIMLRRDFVRSFVLNSVRRHYLTIDHLEKRGEGLTKRTGIIVSRDEIIQALRELVELELVRAKDMAELAGPPEYDSMPPLEDIRPHWAYFMETPEGLAVRREGPPWWPFEDSDDDELRLRTDWLAPDN